MFAADKLILDTKMTKNRLESYCYDMRNNIDSYGSLEKYVDPAVKETILKEINEVVEWLYDAGESTTKEEYETRLQKFSAVGEPAKSRAFYWQEYQSELAKFQPLVDKMNQRLASEECAHLNDEQRASCLKSYEAARAYFEKVEADR